MPERQSRQDLIQEIVHLQEMAGEWTSLFPQAGPQGEHWLKVLSQVRTHVTEDVCRLAVVGAVKSGKSTVINALVGRDLLKRGAGILTAMITRIQPGPEPRAVLRFKEWPQINGEIHRALGLLPSSRLVARGAPLDLKLADDRELLAQVLIEAEKEEIWTEGSLDQNYLLLKSYLEGFDLLQAIIPDSGTLTLAGPELTRHKELVTREATAVYLKDVLLNIPFPWEAQGLELGDCQGSDSPFPQHLAQVLAYLIKCDLVLYVISSRVGLRQADFQFLGELNRMGLVPHILALLNLDLGEHDSFYEVVRMRERVLRELSPWQPEPRLYAFSALKVLLNRRQAWGEKLDPKEEALLAVWAVDPESVAFSDQEAARFEKDLRATLEDLRVRHLAGGSLSQVQMVARGLKEQLELTQDLLGKDLSALKSLESRLKERRQPLQATRASLRQTLEGAGQRLKKVLKDRVSRVLDRHSGQVGAALTGFINAYEPDWGRLVPPGATAATFRPMLYQLFQDLLKELTHFVAAEVNVSLVEFIREQEEWLRQELARAGAPLLLSLKEALSLYYLEMEALGLPFTPPALEMAANPRPENLEVPLLTLEFDPGWWWTGEVWVLAGAGFLGRAWVAVKRRLGLGKGEPQGPLLRDLGRALKTIKNWLKAQVKVQMIDYQERLKFRYFLPLVDQWLQEQENHLDNTLGSLFADLEGVTGAMHLQEEERAVRRRRLGEMIPAVKEMEMQLAAGG